MARQICKSCKGSGKDISYTDIVSDTFLEMPCRTCKGEGEYNYAMSPQNHRWRDVRSWENTWPNYSRYIPPEISELWRKELEEKPNKIKVKKEKDCWVIISACGNFKEQYSSWQQVLRRLGEMKFDFSVKPPILKE